MKYTHKGLTITIKQDDSPESPRSWDTLGTMVCFSRKHALGDAEHGYDAADYASMAEVEEAIREHAGQDAIILPLWLLDHSGLSMSCGERRYPYDCPWDSCQVGYIFVSMADARREWETTSLTPEEIAAAKNVLRQEVKIYDQYLRGEVYGYRITDEEGEFLDSCSGFYGLDVCKQEAESMACWHVNDRRAKAEEACAAAEQKDLCLLGEG